MLIFAMNTFIYLHFSIRKLAEFNTRPVASTSKLLHTSYDTFDATRAVVGFATMRTSTIHLSPSSLLRSMPPLTSPWSSVLTLHGKIAPTLVAALAAT
jgi:hypothetical protein